MDAFGPLMPTNYPTQIDSYNDPTKWNPIPRHDGTGEHSNAYDAIIAIETFLGTSSSPNFVPSSGTVITISASDELVLDSAVATFMGTRDLTITLSNVYALAAAFGLTLTSGSAEINMLASDNSISMNAAKQGFFGADAIAQPAAITAPTGGAVIDGEARTAIAALIDLLSAAQSGLGLTA